jgi:hypothetical protein
MAFSWFSLILVTYLFCISNSQMSNIDGLKATVLKLTGVPSKTAQALN